jgi:hypothetical protein
MRPLRSEPTLNATMPQFFTSQFKQRVRVTAATLTMIAGAAPFVGGLLVMQALGNEATGVVPATVAALSFLAGGALPWLVQNLMGLAGNAGLQRRLREHLHDAAGCDLTGTTFVGFSPGERLHIWQGETDRDVGFLSLTENALIYRGDDFSWTLPRDLIDNIDLTPSEAGLRRILIRWHVPREAGRSLSLESRDACSLTRARRASETLFQRLRDWHRATATTPAVTSTETAALGFPPTDMTGGQIVEEPPSGSCASMLALSTIVLIIIWRTSGAFFSAGQYYHGILWAGLISVLGALSTGYLLHYLQAWEAAHGRATR